MSIVGNRIYTKVERPDAALIEQFRGLPSSNINDEMNRLYCMHDYIRLLNPGKAKQLLGSALTVKAPVGDNLFLHQALEMAQPGDVIVVDGGSGCNRSLAGEIMLRYAAEKGVAGIVVDGCLRDLEGIERLAMPVYAKGITPQGPYKNGPGEINVPIACPEGIADAALTLVLGDLIHAVAKDGHLNAVAECFVFHDSILLFTLHPATLPRSWGRCSRPWANRSRRPAGSRSRQLLPW